jgi:hypothetical protein
MPEEIRSIDLWDNILLQLDGRSPDIPCVVTQVSNASWKYFQLLPFRSFVAYAFGIEDKALHSFNCLHGSLMRTLVEHLQSTCDAHLIRVAELADVCLAIFLCISVLTVKSK